MKNNKFEVIGNICDLIFWIIILVSLTVFHMVFSTSFWVVIALLGIIQAACNFFKKQ